MQFRRFRLSRRLVLALPAVLVQFMGLQFMGLLVWATSFYPQPFPETVQETPVIVRGKVGMNYTDWGIDDDGMRRVYTYYEVQVGEVLKGSSNRASIVIRELGGEKDGVGLHVEGASHYTKGEDVVVFLRNKNQAGSYDVRGMMMGKYNIQTGAEGEEYLQGGSFFAQNHQFPPPSPDPNDQGQNSPTPRAKWTLQDLRTLIQSQNDTASSTPLASHENENNLQKTRQEKDIPSSKPSTQQPAFQLQNNEEDNKESETFKGMQFYFGAGLGLAGIVTLIFLFRRKNKRH